MLLDFQDSVTKKTWHHLTLFLRMLTFVDWHHVRRKATRKLHVLAFCSIAQVGSQLTTYTNCG
jgi:hypothetical protein